jgi:predicted phosphodiesterase
VRLVLMADTHVPKRARDLPAELWAAVDAADVVIHGGDWVDVALLDALEPGPRGCWAATATTTARRCGRGCRRLVGGCSTSPCIDSRAGDE